MTSDLNGYARYRSLALQLGLPGRYVVSLAAPRQSAQLAAVTKLDFVSSISSIIMVSLNASVPASTQLPPVEFGQLLPSITVRLLDENGTPMKGKRYVIYLSKI